MALGPTRTIMDLDLNFVQGAAGERGGMVSFVEMSGVYVVGYLADVSCARPLGIQLNDVEEMDLSRQYHPALDRGMREVDRPGTTVGLSKYCTIDTNFIHPDAQPYSGATAYLAPSGLLTTSQSFGGIEVGMFLSDLNDTNVFGLPVGSEPIVIYGGGYYREQVFTKTFMGWTIGTQGTLPTFLTSIGWARVRIKV